MSNDAFKFDLRRYTKAGEWAYIGWSFYMFLVRRCRLTP